jgi:hypothetical protein
MEEARSAYTGCVKTATGVLAERIGSALTAYCRRTV